jgi:PPM family protein phosphatase
MITTTQLCPVDKLPDSVGRYRLRQRLDIRGEFERWSAEDETGTAVIILTEPLMAPNDWPCTPWEDRIRDDQRDLGLSSVRDRFEECGRAFLALEYPEGVTLWEAWDDPAFGTSERYGWLRRLADLIRGLHRSGAILEGLRPEQVRISARGEVFLDPTVVLLPFPTPDDFPIRPSLVSAPELIDGQPADPRSDLYCIGTVLYALELGHELSELDFRGPGDPLPFLERFPDAHPLLGRLIGRTLARFREARFPSAEADDLTGFDELTATLAEAQRAMSRARLDVAAWTTAGMVRAGNEDAIAVVRATELRDGVDEEYAIILAADGMGGSAAGEVAAELTVQNLRRRLLRELPWRHLTDDLGQPPPAIEQEAIRDYLADALHGANRLVFQSARDGAGHRGMGCTAEVVYVDGQQVAIGHIGDSRIYLLHRGQMRQLTRDHTLVERMVEMGRLTAEQAANHPRRNELRQAIGCLAEIQPDVSAAAIVPGDWLVVCTDGLTGCLSSAQIQSELEQSASAEAAARRLINRANQLGAADNVSVAVVRAM